jgi:hypothetical protein
MTFDTIDSLWCAGEFPFEHSFLPVFYFSIKVDIKLSRCLTSTFILWFSYLSLALFIADLLSYCSKVLIRSANLFALRSSCSLRRCSFFWLFLHFSSYKHVSAFLFRYFVNWSKIILGSLDILVSSTGNNFLALGLRKL